MADDKKSSTSALPTTGIVWAVIFLAGAFLAREVPWLGSRPTGADPKAYAYAAKQDIDSRLWQDPLGAVVRGRGDIRKQLADAAQAAAADPARGKPPSERSEHAFAQLQAQLSARSDQNPSALILGVMIPGGAYPESVEYRRRARYATVAGLHRMGFVPDDAEHLGYVMPPPGSGLPEFIAYEWMLSKDDRGPAVLTLWLDENVFGDQAACRFHVLRELLEGRTATCPGPPPSGEGVATYAHPFVVVGPSYTSTLQDLLRTSAASQQSTDGTLPTFYAYGATADPSAIMDSVGSDRPAHAFQDILRHRRLQLFRTIGVDSALGTALNDELKRRGVDPAARANCAGASRDDRRVEHVVLISERDSLYGRSLPELMRREFAGPGCGPAQLDRYIHRYSYLRGLDGQVASLGADAAKAPVADGAGKAAAGSDRSGKEKQIERPEGQGQLDYLRRLSIQLNDLDAELRRGGQGSIKAVGVIGTDVYDKLLILQALRPQFQNVLFFTTDLDARLLHPLEQDWARNLVVASNFGLQLNARLQGDVLPFRDGYQTSAYLSTQIALRDALAGCSVAHADACIGQERIDEWLRRPRVFEIGRTRAFDFSAPREAPCAVGDLSDCTDVQPPGSPRYTTLGAAVIRNGVLLLATGVVLLLLARGFGTRVDRWLRTRARVPLAACVFGLVLVLLLAFDGQPLWRQFAEYLTEHGAGEPVSFVDGVSIWPSEAIRLTAIVLSIGFLFWAWRMLDRNLHDIATALHFEPTHVEMVRQVRAEYRHWTPWQRFVRCFSFRLVEYSGGPGLGKAGLAWSAQVFWQKYLYQGRFAARACRVAAAVVLYFVAAAAVIGYFGAPNTPYRGGVAQFWNQLILPVSVASMLFVIFFVVDATVFCHQIVKALQDDVVGEADTPAAEGTLPSLWAASTLAFYHARFGLTGRHLDAWILMDFITRRTAVVARLIYFPFIVISLMVLSRSTFFDNWTMPIGLILVLGSSVLIVSGCAVLLRNSAEDARRKVLALLNDDLVRAKGDEGRTGQQLEAMIAQVRALRDGAFAPFSQQPVFRALLLPLSTFGGSALLDYLTAASF